MMSSGTRNFLLIPNYEVGLCFLTKWNTDTLAHVLPHMTEVGLSPGLQPTTRGNHEICSDMVHLHYTVKGPC